MSEGDQPPAVPGQPVPGFTPARTGPIGRQIAAELRKLARGAVRAVVGWPGLAAIAVAYAIAAAVFAGRAYPQLLALLTAAVVGVGWYVSPLRRWEARRRQHRSAPE